MFSQNVQYKALNLFSFHTHIIPLSKSEVNIMFCERLSISMSAVQLPQGRMQRQYNAEIGPTHVDHSSLNLRQLLSPIMK